MISKTNTLRRNAALLCAALTGFGLTGLGRAAQAAPSGPILTTSPPTPQPYQSPVYHGGGAPTYPAGGTPTPYPVSPNLIPPAAATPPPPAPYTAPGMAPYLTPLIDPLQGQLQGTPTEIYNGNITQIPSYLLGNFDPTRPPAGLASAGVNTFYPNHFADGGIYSWSGPFSYTAQGASIVTVDDNSAAPVGAPTPPSSFTATSGWAAITDSVLFPAAGTATNGAYLRLPPATNGTATWTLYQPKAGSYSVYFHIPNDLPSGAATPVPEVRDTQVVYAISVLDATGNVTTTTTAAASQTEANDTQFLAGPFSVVAGGSVVVTLTRSSGPVVINNNNNFLVADSMTLQQTVGDVQSAPTVITYDRYPNDFNSTVHPLQYWGIYTPPVTTTVAAASSTGGTTAAANSLPDTTVTPIPPTPETSGTYNGGNILLKTGNPANAFMQDGSTADPLHLRQIRQLVYFGRSDPAASVSSSVDDSANAPAFTSSVGTQVNNATASNGEYKRFNTTEGLVGANAVAIWTVPVPVTGTGSNFFVYAHIPANPTAAPETRLSQVYYSVTTSTGTYGPVAISQNTQGTDALVALPTGALTAAAGTSVVVRLYNVNNSTSVAPPTNAVVVADSVTVSTGTGQGAIYCVDGFTGGVVWRYETPGSVNGASAPVFASPAITKINVLVTPATGQVPAVYATRLVAIVGDNNGQVYCLDAIGNGDGTSNYNVLNPATNAPITISQPAYGGVYGADPAEVTPLAAGTLATTAAPLAHVGTTGVYWIYRPDASRPKFIRGTESAGKIKTPDPTTDLPVPAAFATASPNVFVDPTVPTTTAQDTVSTTLTSNAKVYIGSSNGVLYALDALGASIDGTTAATYTASGDTFNVSQIGGGFDVPTGIAGNPYPLTAVVPTPQPVWWFSLRGVDPNGGENASSADIESAPAIYVNVTPPTGAVATDTFTPTVYIGSAHELETTSNVGRLYALNGLYGPSGNNGRSPSNPAATGHAPPGSFNYNVGQIPQVSKTDTADWSFPDANTTTQGSLLAGYAHTSSNSKPRPALGNITGSPVVFTNTDENIANKNADNSPRQTRIFFAANSGYEATTAGKLPVARPDDGTTGRLWAVNLDGSVGTTVNSTASPAHIWSYPLANDPNNATLDTALEPSPPMGAFLRATPAIGYVQFPVVITNGDGSAYDPADAVNTGINGKSVPMLYVGTAGVNDTSLYALDIDGDLMPLPAGSTTLTSSGTVPTDQRTIYRLVSPDGSIYQSSPALIANASSTGGNGGDVFAVAGNTLYDYSATPISSPFAGQQYPIVPENKAFVGFGPISSPAVAGADTTDQSTTFLGSYAIGGAAGFTNTSQFTTNTTDWVYVGDSSTGLCRGITPYDTSYGGIAIGLGSIVPFDANAPGTQLLDAFIQAFLVKTQTSTSFSADTKRFGLDAPLPVYEWGESAYVRFSNVAPPNPTNDTKLYVHDTRLYPSLIGASVGNPIPFYTSDGTTTQSVTFNLSNGDATAAANPNQTPDGTVNPQLILAPKTPPDGFVVATDTPPAYFKDVTTNLYANNGNRYLGTYTYTIADGTGRSDTPGARRHFYNVLQKVTEYDFTNSTGDGDVNNPLNYVKSPKQPFIGGDATSENIIPQLDPTTKQYTFTATSSIASVDQPTFGILNPLAARGGGVPLLASTPIAVPAGDELGPFRAVDSPPTLSTTAGKTTTVGTDYFALQALTNGNNVLTVAPPSSSGSGGSPIVRPDGATDTTGASTPTTTAVVLTTTGEIAHNTTGDNSETSAQPTGTAGSGTIPIGIDGLTSAQFGGFALDVFDRSALYTLGQTLRLKMGVPGAVAFSPPSSKDGLYWNSNFTETGGLYPDNTGHDSVVNFLPWETPPVPYIVGSGNMTNGSQDYPDITPGNITQTATASNGGASAGDLTSNNISLPQATPGGGPNTVTSRTMYGDPIRIQVSVPHYQPANQQLYQEPEHQSYTAQPTSTSQQYRVDGQIPPVMEDGTTSPINGGYNVFPMGYVTHNKRLYVPNAQGRYDPQRPYRDVSIYTGVPIDMRTSVADTSATTDIGKVPAAFGVQTESDSQLGLFSPYGVFDPLTNALTPSPFQANFKPLEIHNDGNVNLLNVHFDQKIINGKPTTLQLFSDTVDSLSFLGGYDINDITGPRPANALTPVPEQSFLIRTSIDTDLMAAFGRNPAIKGDATLSQAYPGATFHKPIPGGSQPSTLMVPDAPERYVAGASPEAGTNFQASPSGNPILPGTGVNAVTYQAQPFVSLAMPFGTPVGTYSTPGAQDINSLRLFEGLDTGATYGYNPNTTAGQFYPPNYGGAIGGLYGGSYNGHPYVDRDSGEIVGTGGVSEGVYNSTPPQNNSMPLLKQPLSTSGTQLIGHVLEQRLTDGATYGAVPMIDAGPAGPIVTQAAGSAATSTPDFAPAAFRDPNTGDLSVYWTSGRTAGTFGIFGANLPFTLSTSSNVPPGTGYFLPSMPPTAAIPSGAWWTPFTPTLAGGTNSGLSVTPGLNGRTNYAFDVAVSSTAPYSNTLYSYTVTPANGTFNTQSAAQSQITPDSDRSQVKYGVKGLYTGFTNNNGLYAFWTATTRGRTALYYSAKEPNGNWPQTTSLLPVPAGLTAVADASPMLMMAPVNGALATTIEVTYSGTAPDGNIDLYASRYQPHVKTSAQDTTPPSQLDLVQFPPVTENLRLVGGWYQSRDVAWSRTGALNVSVLVGGAFQPLLYNGANVPQFTKAIYDKVSGLLVLTGVKVPIISPLASPPLTTTNTVYVDAATGRVRFSPALLPSQSFGAGQIRATFSPQAKRLTLDSRADTAPVTFLDETLKPNDAADVTKSTVTNNVKADRRWTIWRKSGSAGVSGSASLYFKTQRLTLFLPPVLNTTTGKDVPIDPTQSVTVTVNGTDVSSLVDVDYLRGRIYFPISTGAEGVALGTGSQGVVVTYTPFGFTSRSSAADANNTVQWQDEQLANDDTVPPADSAAGLDMVLDYGVPIDTAVNENNVAAFLDPFAGTTVPGPTQGTNIVTGSHKVWLFWNSTRNGTADIYSETIDPRFAPGP